MVFNPKNAANHKTEDRPSGHDLIQVLSFFLKVGIEVARGQVLLQVFYVFAISAAELVMAFSLVGFSESLLGKPGRALALLNSALPAFTLQLQSHTLLIFGSLAAAGNLLSAVLNLSALSNCTSISVKIRNRMQERVLLALDSPKTVERFPALRVAALWDPLVTGVAFFLDNVMFHLVSSFSRLVAACCILITAFALAPVMTSSMLFCGFLYWSFLSKVVYKKTAMVGKGTHEVLLSLRQLLSEHIVSYRELRFNDLARSHRMKIQQAGAKSVSLQRRLALCTWIPRASLDVILAITIVAISVTIFLTDSNASNIASMSLMLAILFKTVPSVQTFASMCLAGLSSVPAINLIIEFLDFSERPKPESALPLPEGKPPSVAFKEVTCGIFSDSKHCKAINVVLPSTGFVAIVGRSGSGKSTFLELLCGVRKPASGNILIGDRDLWGESLSSWRDRVLYIPPSPSLFSSTLAANISLDFGQEPPQSEGLRSALSAAQLDLGNSPARQLHAVLEKDESGLSAGEVQRIGIARAIFRSPKVLVMDETTGGLDPKTETAVLASLAAMKRQSLVVISTHRISTLGMFDHVLIFDQGSLIGSGTPAELSPLLRELDYPVDEVRGLKDFEAAV